MQFCSLFSFFFSKNKTKKQPFFFHLRSPMYNQGMPLPNMAGQPILNMNPYHAYQQQQQMMPMMAQQMQPMQHMQQQYRPRTQRSEDHTNGERFFLSFFLSFSFFFSLFFLSFVSFSFFTLATFRNSCSPHPRREQCRGHGHSDSIRKLIRRCEKKYAIIRVIQFTVSTIIHHHSPPCVTV